MAAIITSTGQPPLVVQLAESGGPFEEKSALVDTKEVSPSRTPSAELKQEPASETPGLVLASLPVVDFRAGPAQSALENFKFCYTAVREHDHDTKRRRENTTDGTMVPETRNNGRERTESERRTDPIDCSQKHSLDKETKPKIQRSITPAISTKQSAEILINMVLSLDISKSSKGSNYDEAIQKVAEQLEAILVDDRIAQRGSGQEENNFPGLRTDEELKGYSGYCADKLARRLKAQKDGSYNNIESFTKILPTELRNRMSQATTSRGYLKCLATTKQNKQCSFGGEYIDYGHVKRCLDNISATVKAGGEFSDIVVQLFEIAEAGFCKNHHQGSARISVLRVNDHFYKTFEGRAVHTPEQLKLLQEWLTVLYSGIPPGMAPTMDAVSYVSVTAQEEAFVGLTFGNVTAYSDYQKIGFDPGQYRLAGHLAHVNLKDYQPKDVKPTRSTREHVEDIMRTKVRVSTRDSDESQDLGVVYIFWHRGSFGYVKIGMTRHSVGERLAQWKAECGHDILEVDCGPRHERIVQYPQRVEQLVHAELRACRKEEPRCSGCSKKHIEWFEANQERAVHVVRKWTRWMQEHKPYDNEGNFRGAPVPELQDWEAKVAKLHHDRTKTSHQGSERRSDRLLQQLQQRGRVAS